MGIGNLQRCSTDAGSVRLSSQQLAWETPGVCPSCGVVTDHRWFSEVLAQTYDPQLARGISHELEGSQGRLLVSVCMSEQCQALTVWIKSRTEESDDGEEESDDGEVELVFPQPGARPPPAEGLTPDEIKLYEEAAGIAPASRRAASALLRVLLEAFLKRHLTKAGHSVKDEPLVKLISLAVEHLALSPTLRDGLTAIRKRGNAAVHDPYGLTDDARAEQLPRLFQAVDQLVDDLHVTPLIWADMAGNNRDEPA